MDEPAFPTATQSITRFWQAIFRPRAHTAWLRQRYGHVATFFRDGEHFIVLLSSEGARQVLSAEPAGYDPFWKAGFTGLVGPGSLWVLGGEAHRRERQLLSPAFHSRSFGGYGEVIRQTARRHIEQWRPRQTLRAIDTTLAISLDIIMRVVFGTAEGPFLEDGRRVLSAILRTIHPAIVFFPGLQRPWFPPWARYARAKADFTDWVNRYLALRRAGSVRSDDVLGRMLAARYADGSPMRDADIRDELITILLAGHETTATALAWALYELGRHPPVLEKLRAELASSGSEADPGLTVKLPYLSAVCNETLRLHTLLAEVARVTIAPVTLFGHTIPPGHSLVISAIAIHHDPDLYPHPDNFRPERFLERTYSASEFLPFGGGHRRCLGAGLSDYEMRIVLAEIVTHWDFEPTRVDRDIRHDIAMGPKYGVPLRIKARRQPGQAIEPLAKAGEAAHA